MKQIIALLLAAWILLCFSACGEAEAPQADNSSKTPSETVSETRPDDLPTQTSERGAKEGTSDTEQEKSEDDGAIFTRFGRALQERGDNFETTEMAASLVGAERGVKYTIGEGKVELYLFDENSEAYAAAFASQTLTVEGFGDLGVQDARVSSGVAILVIDLDEETYYAIFDDLVK